MKTLFEMMYLSAVPFCLVPPPTGLSDTKCPSSESLHHSRPRFSFLPSRSPKFLRRVAPRSHGSGYGYRVSDDTFFGIYYMI